MKRIAILCMLLAGVALLPVLYRATLPLRAVLIDGHFHGGWTATGYCVGGSFGRSIFNSLDLVVPDSLDGVAGLRLTFGDVDVPIGGVTPAALKNAGARVAGVENGETRFSFDGPDHPKRWGTVQYTFSGEQLTNVHVTVSPNAAPPGLVRLYMKGADRGLWLPSRGIELEQFLGAPEKIGYYAR